MVLSVNIAIDTQKWVEELLFYFQEESSLQVPKPSVLLPGVESVA